MAPEPCSRRIRGYNVPIIQGADGMAAARRERRIDRGWAGERLLSLAEKIADGIVHGVGLVLALVAGSVLLTLAAVRTAPEDVPALAVYVGAFLLLLGVSMAFNLWPNAPIKRLLSRFDQAAIFLFIAATYTPFLSQLWSTPKGLGVTIFIWCASLIGVALKLALPQRYAKLVLPLYLVVGWSGVVVFQELAHTMPRSALILLLAGGLSYSFGIVFYLWEKLKFYTAVWHSFVIVGASLHLIAIFEAMVFSRW